MIVRVRVIFSKMLVGCCLLFVVVVVVVVCFCCCCLSNPLESL